MSRIDAKEVQEIAQLARLRLDPEEVARLTSELDAILGHIDELRQLDTSAVEPMTHAVPFDCPMREDLPGPMLSIDEALANAPAREGSFFQVPRIIAAPGGGGQG
jgi:aspartyl-tRNA(Asn)/glutamyl-tRNA(Gln) amidotransferase subunit C